MAIAHLNVSIVKASEGQSAVSKAAYQSAERLYCEKDMTFKYYPYKQSEIVYQDILLPSHAPESFHDRATLWNAVEKQCNAQLARNIIIAIPNEIPTDMFIELIKEYCMEEFVSKGMCCDVAIHDKGDGNPHAHILLTMRALDEHGKWVNKSRKVYDLDDDGNRIKLPSGNYKSHKENVTDWDNKDNVEKWRQSWATHANKYLELCGSDVRIDLRSYERQGIDKIPTVHMGNAASEMERKGIKTYLGDLNRDIISFNELMDMIVDVVTRLLDMWHVLTTPQPHEESLADYVSRYLDIRAEGRINWSITAQSKCDIRDFLDVYRTLCYLETKDICSKDGLASYLQSSEQKENDAKNTIKDINSRVKKIDAVITAKKLCHEYKPLVDEYEKIFFKSRKKAFYDEHKDELDSYYKKKTYLEKYAGKDAGKKVSELQKEKEMLLQKKKDCEEILSYKKTDSEKLLRSICRTIKSAPNAEAENKKTIHDRIRENKYRSDLVSDNKSPQRKTKGHKYEL